MEWEPLSTGADQPTQHPGRGLAVVPEPLPDLDQAQPAAVLVELGRSGQDTITVDLAELHGLDLAGPGGPAATRAVLAQLHHHSDPACRATVLLSRRHAERLLGPDADLDHLTHTGALNIYDTVDELLDHVELELIRRGRVTLETRPHPHHDTDDEDVDPGPQPAWVIFAKPASETHHRRLAALISMGAAHRITALLTTDHPRASVPGAAASAAATTLSLAPDGTITHARGEHGEALRAVHLLTATRDATLDLLTTPPEPPTTNSTHSRGGHSDQPGQPGPASETTAKPAGQKTVEYTQPTMSSITAALDPYLAAAPDTTAPVATTEPAAPAATAAPAAPSTPPPTAPTAGSTLAPTLQAQQEHERPAGADRSSSPVVVTSEPHHATPAAATGTDRAPGDPGGPPIPDDALLVLRCFGPRLTVHARGTPGAALVDITDRLSPKRRLLVAVLAASLTPVLTDELLEAAWPDVALRSARQRLHTTIAQIRQILRVATNTDHDWILLIHGGESYRLDTKIWVDHHEFTEALRTARGALTPAETATALRTAISLHSGPFAADLDDPWIDTHRHHTTDQHTAAVHELLDRHAADLTNTDQTTILAAAFRDNPTHHATTARLVRAYLADQQPDQARHVYDQHTQHLDTLDLTPHPTLTALLPSTDTTHRAC